MRLLLLDKLARMHLLRDQVSINSYRKAGREGVAHLKLLRAHMSIIRELVKMVARLRMTILSHTLEIKSQDGLIIMTQAEEMLSNL